VLQNYALAIMCYELQAVLQAVSRAVNIVSMVSAGRPGFDLWQDLGVFHFATAYSPPLGPTHPPVQWLPVAFPRG
jgi:hypothetical protein